MDDELIVQLYWDRSENAISETDRKYGAYCNNAEIAWHNVTTKDKSNDFTNLTSARIYRLECTGLEGCTLIIS